MVSLTFDDGPDPRGTPAVLDALARAGARATFFVLGERVTRAPDLLARMLAEGHAVEVHGYGHRATPARRGRTVEADLDAALAGRSARRRAGAVARAVGRPRAVDARSWRRSAG